MIRTKKTQQSEDCCDLAIAVFHGVSSWTKGRSWKGLDPYDLKELLVYRKSRALPWPLGRVASRLWRFLERKAPGATRDLLGVSPKANSLTFALVARAHLALAEFSNDPKHVDIAKECLNWLLRHPGAGMGGGKLGWGHPFTWYAGPQSKEIIPANTPLSTICIEAGHAFLDMKDYTGEIEFLEHARQVGEFLVSDLNRVETDDGGLCFSYGPTDSFQVINSNLGIAAFLTRLFSYGKDTDMRRLARRARLYCRARQKSGGSWGYWGHDEDGGKIDHYHTGMNLQWLCVCQQYDPLSEDDLVLRHGAAFYKQHMFDPDGAPRMLPESRYPINIHSCAQALVTLRHLHEARAPDALALLRKTLHWTLRHMRNPDGSFAYSIEKRTIDRTPHMRWGQAWMMWGLANAIKALQNAEKQEVV